jgi:hypothetical protein
MIMGLNQYTLPRPKIKLSRVKRSHNPTFLKTVTRFLKLLQLATTSTGYALTILYTSQITVGHTRPSQSVTVFTSRCLVTVSNNGRSPSSGFPKCPRHQLPASHSNSSQRLNCSSPLTNSPLNTSFPTCPAYHISAWTAEKTPFLLHFSGCCLITAVV